MSILSASSSAIKRRLVNINIPIPGTVQQVFPFHSRGTVVHSKTQVNNKKDIILSTAKLLTTGNSMGQPGKPLTSPPTVEYNLGRSTTSTDAGAAAPSASGSVGGLGLNLTRNVNVPKELNFVSKLNGTTGKMEWVELPEDYDFHQEIARSAYADMLHDHDRNIRYFQALRFEIAQLKARGEPAHVLDIGTGTGLLSMMAVVCGADSVFACDAFTPMLECARNVVKRNGFADKIKLIPKRSTELKVGVDLPYRCNILVTEVFDTELIGEGAISTFNHAHKELLTETAVVIPSASTVYAQVVHSKEVEKWNSLPKTLELSSVSINFPAKIASCPGVPSVQDLQLDAIKRPEFTLLSPPLPIYSFDFTSPNPIPDKRSISLDFKSESDAQANTIFLWWDLDMDTSGNNILSCQPAYIKQGPSHWQEKCKVQDATWRDHWMHSVYYIPRSAQLNSGEDGVLCAAHDEYAFWFDVIPESKTESVSFPKQHPVCECGVHNIISRSQMRMMNDAERYEIFLTTFKRFLVSGETTCLCISDCSILPVILVKLGAKKVIVMESCKENENICKEILEANKIDSSSVHFIQSEGAGSSLSTVLAGSEIDLVVGDPYFQVAVYPWNHLMFWYQLKSINKSLLSPAVKLAPGKAILRCMAVNFTHLWKIHAPVKVAADQFDLTDFDELIKNSSSISDSSVDAQPLWEYESVATSEPITMLEFNLLEDPVVCLAEGQLKLSNVDINTNGIALWIDWEVDSDSGAILSTGPKERPTPGQAVVWERFSKQGVYFVENRDVKSDVIKYQVAFDSETAEFTFRYT